MTGQVPLGRELQPPGSLALTAPVWGIDPSTQRISVASVRNGLGWADTLSLSRVKNQQRRWSLWYSEIVAWLPLLPGTPPAHVFVEEPFMPTERRQKPTSYYLMGVLWAALGAALPPEVRFEEIGPGTWKRTAMGEGRGAAKPWEYMEWARDVAGYRGSIEDEAAAIGVATAGGVIVSGG